MDKEEEKGKESTDSAGQKNEKNGTTVIPILRNNTSGEYDNTFVQEIDTKHKDTRRKGKDYYDEEEKAEFSNNTGSESNLDSRPSPNEPLVSRKLLAKVIHSIFLQGTCKVKYGALWEEVCFFTLKKQFDAILIVD